MQFECETTGLAKAVANAAKVTTERGAAVLRGVLLRTTSEGIAVTGTNLDVTIQTTVDAAVSREGSCVVPGKLAAQILASLEEGKATISLGEKEGERVEIKAARSRFNLNTFNVSEFPALPTVELATGVTGAIFAEALSQVTKAASRDESRPILTGVFVTSVKNKLRLVATDSYRMAIRDLEMSMLFSNEDMEGDIIVPALALGTLGATYTQAKDDLYIGRNENLVTFACGQLQVWSRLLSGTYPDYLRLVPEHPACLEVNRERFLSALGRVKLLVQDNTTPVRLHIDPEGVTLRVQSPQIGDATERLPGKFNGQDLAIAFNPTYLMDGLDSITTDEVVLHLGDNQRPGLLVGKDDNAYKCIIMPVRVS